MANENIIRLSRFNTLRDNTPKPTTWTALADEIRGEALAHATNTYRQWTDKAEEAERQGDRQNANTAKNEARKVKETLPGFIAWVALDNGRTQENIRDYTGFIVCDIDHIPPEKMAAAEKAVKDDPHTVLAYVTVSGRGLRAVAFVENVDYTNFREAWLTVNEYYRRLTSLDYDRACSDTTRLSALAHDPAAVYRPKARPMKIDAKGRAAAKGKGKEKQNSTATAGEKARRIVESNGCEYARGQRNQYVARCLYWMNRFGVAQEKALEWALKEFDDYNSTDNHPLPSMVKSIYGRHPAEHATCRPKAYFSKAKATIKEVETFINDHCRLRRNLFTQQVEICSATRRDDDSVETGPWRQLDDTAENTLWCDMQRCGMNIDMQTLTLLTRSDFAPDYHPMRAYLDSLPRWDGKTDHIGRLFAMVHCRDASPEVFDYYTRKWFVGMVASAMFDEVVNNEIFTLIGPQGSFKTSFMNNILPPELRQYYTSKTNSQRMTKDDRLALSENILVNLEEIDSMQRQEVNQLKALTTLLHVNERPAYGRNKVRLPHVASFCATGNNKQFINDDTGSRRWLVFEVQSIDNPWTTPIPYAGIYAQAKALIDEGFVYWFEGNEVERLNKRNREYEVPNMARELIASHYRKPTGIDVPIYLTSSQIVARFGGQIRLNAVMVGRALSELGFTMTRTSHARYWAVVENTPNEVVSSVHGDLEN